MKNSRGRNGIPSENEDNDNVLLLEEESILFMMILRLYEDMTNNRSYFG
jgi:hypothetical protein